MKIPVVLIELIVVGVYVPKTVQKEYNEKQIPFFDFVTEDFPVALLGGGKGLPEAGYESVKAEAQENIRLD